MSNKNYKLVVVGAGAAGLMAAVTAAKLGVKGSDILLIEKNDRIGKKLFITGKGRCNITNACDRDAFFKNIMGQSKFLYSSFSVFDNNMVIDFFEEAGVKTKIERGERVFPASDHSSDVIGAFKRLINRLGIDLLLNTAVKSINTEYDSVTGVTLQDGTVIEANAVIIATGGVSYPLTGSTGEGFDMVKALGHSVTELRPSLVPVVAKEDYCKDLMGLSARNVNVTITDQDSGKKLYEDFGELLFTHFGLSGPLILSASALIGDEIRKKELTLSIDWKPALTEEKLDERILRDFSENINKDFRNSIGKLAPQRLCEAIIKLSKIDPHKKVCDITKEERQRLVSLLKDFKVTLTGLRDFDEAIITKGGVSLKEVSPKTLESKKIASLYIAGEMLDLDALTGGFNLQIAWSTGFAAGSAAAEQLSYLYY